MTKLQDEMLLRDLGDEGNFIAKGINYYLGVIKFFNHWRGCAIKEMQSQRTERARCWQGESSGMKAQTCLIFDMLAMRLHEEV